MICLLQGPPPDYDAVDANYYVTWGHFADWVNTLLEHMPHEIEAMQKDASAGTPERTTSTRRSARNGDGQYASAVYPTGICTFQVVIRPTHGWFAVQGAEGAHQEASGRA